MLVVVFNPDIIIVDEILFNGYGRGLGKVGGRTAFHCDISCGKFGRHSLWPLVAQTPVFITTTLTSWLANSGIVRSNEISLSALVLRKGISTSLLDSLNGTNLMNSLAEPFLSRPVIWNIKLLDLLDNVVWLRCICAFVARYR